MQHRIKTGQFCALSKETKFQVWLSTKSPELYQMLMNHLQESSSCKSNIIKMTQIREEMNKLGMGDDLIDFLKKNYPLTIAEVSEDTAQSLEFVKNTIILEKITDSSVFKYYNPKLLTFPHKLVMYNTNHVALEESVYEFVQDKLDYDYIIVGHYAYIEYFHFKYKQEAAKIAQSSRELFKYRLRGEKHG